MDVSRPLREFHVLNIKTSNAESFGIGKFHHSLGDGMSLMSLLYASSRKTSDPSFSYYCDYKKTCWIQESLVVGCQILVYNNDHFTTFVEMFKFILTLCYLRDTKTLLVGKFGNKVQSRKVIHRIISLDDVKFVKNTMNVVDI